MKNFKVTLHVTFYWADFVKRAIYFDIISLQQNTIKMRIHHKVLQEVYDWVLHLYNSSPGCYQQVHKEHFYRNTHTFININ